jgi:hypothetical protein
MNAKRVVPDGGGLFCFIFEGMAQINLTCAAAPCKLGGSRKPIAVSTKPSSCRRERIKDALKKVSVSARLLAVPEAKAEPAQGKKRPGMSGD